jgi:F-type H+-transporting ATPase subunit gamma
MPSTQIFRRKIKSISNTQKITKAMEMISSIKMQRATERMERLRPYAKTSWDLLARLIKSRNEIYHPLFEVRKVNRICLVVVASDRGLCGNFNSEVRRKLYQWIDNFREKGGSDKESELDLVAVGSKAASFIRQKNYGTLVGEFRDFGKEIEFKETTPITKFIIDDFLSEKYDKVVMIYTQFISSLTHQIVARQILPATADEVKMDEESPQNIGSVEYRFEPSPAAVLEKLLPSIIRINVYQAILESNASEHSARMVAMKNATDNAKDMIDDLKLTYNSVRQASITSELADITAAAEVFK